MAEQDANDISQMMPSATEATIKQPKKSKFLWIVLGCVIIGIGLGIVVYQQSTKPVTTVKTTPRPTVVATPTPVATSSATPVESPTTPDVSVVDAVSNTVNFPKAGKVRVYWDGNGNYTLKVVLEIAGVKKTIQMPAKTDSEAMAFIDSTVTLTGPTAVKVTSFLGTNPIQSLGWIAPNSASKCGANGFGLVDVTTMVAYATTQAKGEPLVSKQCWADQADPNDSSSKDFNDYFVILSYVPPSGSASPSPSGSAAASPSPSASVAASPSPSPSVAASPTPTPSTATPTPTPSSRAAMPDTSDGTPVTGVFEVTVGTVSVGLLLLLLGLFGLLAL